MNNHLSRITFRQADCLSGLCLCILLLAPIPTYAQEELQEEQSIIRDPGVDPLPEEVAVENVLQETEPAVPEPDPEILRQAAQDRVLQERVIAELEENASLNAYSADLTEAYLNLAGTLSTLAEYDDAASAYDKALQTVRISDGLDSLQQLPILEKVIANNERRQNWDDLDASTHLMFHVARRNFEVGDERRVEALNRLGEWKLRAASEDLKDGYNKNAEETVDLFGIEIALLKEKADYAGKNYHLASMYLGEAKAKLLIARTILDQPLSDFRTSGSPTTFTQRCYVIRLPDGKFQQVCETVEIPNLDYYIDPSNMKNMNIQRNLLDARKDIMEAFSVLQNPGSDEERLEALLTEVQNVTTYYNTFVTENRL